MVRLSGIISINIRIFRKPKKIIFLVYCKPKLFFFPPKKNILSARMSAEESIFWAINNFYGWRPPLHFSLFTLAKAVGWKKIFTRK